MQGNILMPWLPVVKRAGLSWWSVTVWRSMTNKFMVQWTIDCDCYYWPEGRIHIRYIYEIYSYWYVHFHNAKCFNVLRAEYFLGQTYICTVKYKRTGNEIEWVLEKLPLKKTIVVFSYYSDYSGFMMERIKFCLKQQELSKFDETLLKNETCIFVKLCKIKNNTCYVVSYFDAPQKIAWTIYGWRYRRYGFPGDILYDILFCFKVHA